MELVRAWAESCSDPALEELLSSNLLVRWFVGFPLSQAGPDHSTLADFHAYLSAQAPEAFFADVLTFLARVDPEDPASTPQIVDTFALESPVAPCKGPAHLLRHLCLRLARCWLQHAPAALQAALAPLDLGVLARPWYARSALERQQELQSAVSLAAWLVDGLTPHLVELEPGVRTVVSGYLAALAKVQADELSTDASGFVRERPAKERGERRLASALDLEASFRKHDDSPAVLGTNAVISTTATRIRACVALSGSTPDSAAPVAVLEQQREAGLPLPPQLVMDRAGVGARREPRSMP